MALSPELKQQYLGRLFEIANQAEHDAIFDQYQGVDRVVFQRRKAADSRKDRHNGEDDLGPVRVAADDEKVRLIDVYVLDGIPHVSSRSYGREPGKGIIQHPPEDVVIKAADLKLS